MTRHPRGINESETLGHSLAMYAAAIVDNRGERCAECVQVRPLQEAEKSLVGYTVRGYVRF